MKKEIMEHIKNLKVQGINVKVDEDQINDLINKISDIKNKDKKNKHIDSGIDKFLDKYENKNVYISYNKNKNRIKINTEEITKSLKKLHNKLINFSKFDEEYNKFMNDVKGFEDYKAEKQPGSVSINPKKNEKIWKKFKRY